MSPSDNFKGTDGLRPWSLGEIYADLCSKQDIPKALNVTHHRVHSWIVRREQINSPRPLRRLAHIDVYSLQEWRDWFEDWQNKHRRDTKWMDHAKPHGSGESFWNYFEDQQ